jgi:ABC-2 type transport system permease protein
VSGWQAIRLVAGREAADRLRNRAFVFGTVAMLVAVVAAIVIPGILADGEGPRYRLGVTEAIGDGFTTSVQLAASGQGVDLVVTRLADEDAAVEALAAGELDAVFLGDELMSEGGSVPFTLVGLVDTARSQTRLIAEAERLGLDEAEAVQLLESAEGVQVVDLEGVEDDGFSPEQALMAFAATVLLFIIIQINGNSLLTGAIEEKSSRVIEVLLGTLRPRHLLAGKLLALTAIALTQISVVIAGALLANAAVGLFQAPPVTATLVAVTVVMVVVGFVFYAALYTVAGSMTPSIEDAQAIAGPLAMGVIGTYMLVIFAVIPSPEGTAARILTFLPPTAPFTVPARVALEAIPAWQVATAAVITLVGSWLAVRLGGRLYSAALLAGGKLTWRGAWRAEPIR